MRGSISLSSLDKNMLDALFALGKRGKQIRGSGIFYENRRLVSWIVLNSLQMVKNEKCFDLTSMDGTVEWTKGDRFLDVKGF